MKDDLRIPTEMNKASFDEAKRASETLPEEWDKVTVEQGAMKVVECLKMMGHYKFMVSVANAYTGMARCNKEGHTINFTDGVIDKSRDEAYSICMAIGHTLHAIAEETAHFCPMFAGDIGDDNEC